jgi:hypothetical protein
MTSDALVLKVSLLGKITPTVFCAARKHDGVANTLVVKIDVVFLDYADVVELEH